MSDIIYIKELVEVVNQESIIDGPLWLRDHINIRPAWNGFTYAGHQYNYGTWVGLLSDNNLIVQSKEQLLSMVLSIPAFIKAGLSSEVEPTGPADILLAAFREGKLLTFVTPETDPFEDAGDIKILTRAPVRDTLTQIIDFEKTWVVIGSDMISGIAIPGVRLSALVDHFNEVKVDLHLTPRGIE